MTATHSSGNATAYGLRDLPIGQVDHGANPRTDFDSTDMAGLTASVKESGILQPIRVTVEKEGDEERFIVIFGHRRLEAAKAAKLKTIPAIVTEPSDHDFVTSLVENIQREDLSPMEEAQAYQQLRDSGMTVTAIGKAVGRSQPHISNMLRLLKLPDTIQAQVNSGSLTAAHAKNIVSLPKAEQEDLAQRIIEEDLTVRDVEVELAQKRQEADREKESQKRLQEQAEAVAGAVAEIQTIFKRNKWRKRDTIVFWGSAEMDTEAIIEAMQDEGYKNFIRINHATMATEPRWECDCAAVLLSTDRRFDDNPKVCIVPAHKDEWIAKQEAEAAALREEAFKRFDKERRTVAKALRTGPKGALTVDGQRVMLYAYFRLLSKYGGSTQELERLQQRHGGPEVDGYRLRDDMGPIWETISGLNEADLGEEMLDAALGITMLNTYGESSKFTVKIDATFRQWLVDTFGVSDDYVWGKHEAPAPEPEMPQEEVVAALEEEAAEEVDAAPEATADEVDDGAADEPEAITEDATEAS